MKKFSFLAIIMLLTFVKVSIAQDYTQQVTAIQYYFNTDPGVGITGNGDIIELTPAGTIDQAFSFSLPASLPDGINHLYVRARDEFGHWGLAERRSFYIFETFSSQQVTALEYYFDTDPGVGNGTVQSIGPSSSYSGSLAITLPGSLTDGIHQLYIRTKDETGSWSITERRSFFIFETISSQQVTAIEYYFDIDPGVGNGTVQAIGPSSSYSGSLAITLPGSLTDGIHQLYIRTKDETGSWSITERRSFYIQQVNSTELLTALEYYYDTDPGVGNANRVEISPTPSVNGLYELGVPCLSTGTHYLYVRARDENGSWSIIGRDTLQVIDGISPSVISPAGPITFCPTDSVLLATDSIPGILYQWQKDEADIPGATAASFTIHEAGSYQVKSYCGAVFSISNVVLADVLPLLTFYADTDNDGFGDIDIDSLDCTQPFGFVANSDDCDDTDENINPAAAEVCNGIDDNCNGEIDEGVQTTYYADNDQDGYGDPAVTTLACSQPAGFVDNADDCDDTDENVNPAATEICNLIDDDCDGMIDEDVQNTYYADADGDGFGDPLVSILACSAPAGYVSDNNDCDDSDGNVNPAAIELCNGIDDNCDGNVDEGFIYSIAGASITSSNGESFCLGGYTELSVAGGLLGTDAVWAWYEGGCGSGSSIGTGTSVTVTPDAGIHTYFVRAEGTCNNTDCISVEITVNTPPQIITCPVDIVSGNDATLCSAVINYDAVIIGDPAPELTYSFSGATTGSGNGTGSGSAFNAGITTVTITATNICGQESCSFSATVNDTEGPLITGCPSPIDAETEDGQWGAHVSWTEPVCSDNCTAEPVFTSNYIPGDFFNVGTTVVTYTAIDDNGNSSVCQFYVTVTPPDLVGLVNVAAFSSDITFSDNNPDPGSTVSVSAVVKNNSSVDAGIFVVRMKDLFSNTTYPSHTISGLNAGQSLLINDVISTPAIPAFVPIQVTVDLLNDLEEGNELDNVAVRPFTCGTLETQGTIGMTTAPNPATVPAGSVIQICGSAYYEDVTPPLDDPSVAGAELVITIVETGQQVNGFTNEEGEFCYSYNTPNTPGLYHYTVDINDNTLGGDASGTFNLTAPEVVCPLDLSVSLNLAGISPSYGGTYIIPVGSSFSGTVYVNNNCEAVTQSTTLFIGLPAGNPVPGPFTIPPLGPYETYPVSLPTMTMPVPGSTYISATVDYNNIIVESSESNNTANKTLIVLPLLPDIDVVGGNVLSNLQCGADNQVNFGLKNIGLVPTGSFTIDFNIYVNDVLQSSDQQIITNLNPDEYTVVTYPFTSPLNNDLYRFELVADDPDMVVELSEENNQSDFSMNFLPCNLDLLVLGCDYTDVKPADPASPGTMDIYATIINTGQLPITSSFTVDFNVAGNSISVPVTPPVAANQSLILHAIAPVPATPFGVLTITADAGNDIAEKSETNNVYSASLGYDFVFDQSNCSGHPIFKTTQYWCNPANMGIGYWNLGIYEASNFQVKFEISGPGLTGWVNLGTVSTYAANNCGCPFIVTLPNSFMYPQIGTYQVRITADPENLYPEADEDNNVLILSVNVVESADYQILSSYISPSDLNPEINEEITFNVSFSNVGCSGSSQIELYTQVDNVPLYSLFVNPLSQGGMTTVPIPTPWSSAVPGVHVFRGVIDNTDLINEGNEMNNEATRAIIVGEAPDFNVISIASSDMTPVMGQLLTLTADVHNEGQSGGTGLLQFIWADNLGDETIISEQTISIIPGNTVTETTSWVTSNPHARIIARVINVTPIEFDFSDNEKQAQLNDLFVTISSADVLCFNENSGEITVGISGGFAPFTIEWNNPELNGATVNVPAGEYTVTVTDFLGLTVEESISVYEPDLLVLTETHTNASCDNLSDGSIDLLVDGGTEPYSYLWSNGEITQDLSSLGAGTYEVLVTDDNSCSAGMTITITDLFVATSWYQDADNDGYGTNSVTIMSCAQPEGYVDNDTDCDDANAAVNPGVDEVCGNNTDDNCNGETDEGCCDITVDAGDDITTFFGITSMQQVTRTAVVSGGTPPFTFIWTLGRPMICNQENEEGDESFFGGACSGNSCPESGSPTESASCSGSATISAILLDTTSICVTVTDANGCAATDCFTVNASDVRCFAGNSGAHKIKICHHTNSPNNPWVEICVDTNAMDAHLEHGDFIGPCQATQMLGIEEESAFNLNFILYPNPAERNVTVAFTGRDDRSYIVEFVDMTGRKLFSYRGRSFQGENTRQLSLENIVPGMYQVVLLLDGNKEVRKLVVR